MMDNMDGIVETDVFANTAESETPSKKKLKSVISYQVFVLENKSKLHGKYPFLKANQINGKLKSLWNSLSVEEKGNYRKFTLISTPTPPKKSPRAKPEAKKNSCKGRLLPPKAQLGKLSPQSRITKKAANVTDEKIHFTASSSKIKTITDQWDTALFGPFHDSDEEMMLDNDSDLSPEISLCDDDDDDRMSSQIEKVSQSKVPWPKDSQTYKTRYHVQKNYKVPTIVTDKSRPTLSTSGILKSTKKENRKPIGRVSFSKDDAEVKIMSEREDSCSTISASQELGLTLDENPYNFDNIDKFEICVGTPEKENIAKRSPLKGRNNERSLPQSNRKMPQKAKRSAKTNKASPVLYKRMLRSRSPTHVTDHPKGKYVLKFDELLSSPCQEAESGRGDAEESFLSENGAVPEDKELDCNRKETVPEHLLGGGDYQTKFCVNLTKDTPPSVDISKVIPSAALLAPRKRRLRTDCLNALSPKKVKELIMEVQTVQERRKSPRLRTKYDSADEMNSSSGTKLEQEIQMKKVTRKKKEEYKLTETQNPYQSFLDSSDMLKQTSSDTFLKPKHSYAEELIDENSSSSEQETSPALLQSQAKSRLAVAETLRGLKMITSPENVAFSEESNSDSPKLLSPTLSDISVLSSLSSNCGTQNDPPSQPNASLIKGKQFLKESSNQLRRSAVHQINQDNNGQKRGRCSDENSPEGCSQDLHLTEAMAVPRQTKDLLCDMFQDMTPPEQKALSTRRLVSSSSNFPRLFDEEEIFG